MKIGSNKIVRSIDKYCIDILRYPGLLLMENAALKVLKHIAEENCRYYTVVCGRGNNGGDGLAIARQLKALGKKVDVFQIGNGRMSEDCKCNYDLLLNLGVKIKPISNIDDLSILKDSLLKSDAAIDAIFGTGISRNLEELYVSCIAVINENSKNIIAVDVPSGMDSDTGNIMGNCIKANKTITFTLYKKGFLNYKAKKYTGEVHIEEIGIPKEIVDIYHDKEYIISLKDIKNMIPKREQTGHKGIYGRVLIIAGSIGFTGAAYLAAKACIMSGAGLITVACPREIQDVLSSKLAEAMTYGFNSPEELKKIIEAHEVIAIGPGLGNDKRTLELLKLVMTKREGTVIIDADGINVLAENKALLKTSSGLRIIITPHPGEMSRLTGLSIDFINDNRIKVAKEFARDNNVVVLLKGYNTVITDGIEVHVNPTGSSAMASGGMGDSLTGIIAAFSAQGLRALQCACFSAYIHGYTGDSLSEDRYSVNAERLIEEIPCSIKAIQRLL